MEEKNQNQASNNQELVECSKCHKKVQPTECVQKDNKFVCKKCASKSRNLIIIAIVVGLILVAAIVAWLTMGNKQRTGEGFDGVGEIIDSVGVSVEEAVVEFELSATTAVSSAVSTQSPISNLEDFKHTFAQNVSDADNNNATTLIIPSVSPLFEINTNYFVSGYDELVKEFAKAYLNTNKEATILVEGYTCDLGGTKMNDKLSKVRAEAVKKILISEGIPENKIETKWYGKSHYKDFDYSNRNEYRCVILSIK